MEIQKYQNVLLMEIIFVSILTFILIGALITAIIFLIRAKKKHTKKVRKKKTIKKSFFYENLSLCIGLLLSSLVLIYSGQYLFKCSLDLYDHSFVTYIGTCDHPERDTLILHNANKTKLYAFVSIPGTNEELVIIYSKRSKIVVGAYTLEKYEEIQSQPSG